MTDNEGASLIVTCFAGSVAFFFLMLFVSWTFIFPALSLLVIAVFIGRVSESGTGK